MNTLLFRCAVLFIALAALCACSYQSGTSASRYTPMKRAGAIIKPTEGIYVGMPADYTSGSSTVSDSGKRIQDITLAILQEPQGLRVPAITPQTEQQTVADAAAANCAYAIFIRIVDWQDPPAFFQYKPDRGEILLSVYDTKSGELLRSDMIEGTGTASTINGIGFKDPADCLKPEIRRWWNTACNLY